MKKAVCILIALLAFAGGVVVFYVRPLLIPFSLSELRRNSSHYKSYKFKVTGKLVAWKAESTYSINLRDWENDCSVEPNCDYGLEISEEIKAENIDWLKEIASMNHTIGETDFRRIEYFAEAEITGYLVERENKYFGGSSDKIKVDKIKQLSPVKFVLLDEFQKH